MCLVNCMIWILGTVAVAHILCTLETAESVTCSSSHETCSDGNQCVLRQWICDGEEDCLDGSDEEDCARCLPTRWMCWDARRCIPEDWRCDEQTECIDGSDEDTCAVDVMLFIADFDHPIHKINVSDGQDTIIYHEHNGPLHLAYDRVLKFLYWSNAYNSLIHRVRIDGVEHAIVAEPSTRPRGMVIDPLDRLLFYSANEPSVLNKVHLESNITTVIVRSSDNDIIHDLAVDIQNKKLYWVVRGSFTRIKMSDYRGNGIVTVLDEPLEIKIEALTLDSSGMKLFWMNKTTGRNDDRDIMRLDLNTRTCQIVPYGEKRYLGDMDILDSTLYLIDRRQGAAYLTIGVEGGTPELHPHPQGMQDLRKIKVTKIKSVAT